MRLLVLGRAEVDAAVVTDGDGDGDGEGEGALGGVRGGESGGGPVGPGRGTRPLPVVSADVEEVITVKES